MKALLLLVSISISSISFSQDICMVSADYQTGENMIVMWEWPASTVGLDSVLVYRKNPGTGSNFVKIGGTPVGQLSAFTDVNAVTTEYTYYKISYKYTNGTESSQSPWHRPLLLDYGLLPGTMDLGNLTWTEYEIEFQTGNGYINGYNCYIDQSGLGNFVLMSSMPNTILSWWDQSYAFNPNTVYMIEVELPNCDINKANINTSRSNIKKQIFNIEVGTDELEAKVLHISPNPVEDVLFIPTNHDFQLIEIMDQTGKTVFSEKFAENELNVSFLKAGIYTIRTLDSKGIPFTNKLVKL